MIDTTSFKKFLILIKDYTINKSKTDRRKVAKSGYESYKKLSNFIRQ